MNIEKTSTRPLVLSIDTSQKALCMAILKGSSTLLSVIDQSEAPHSRRLFPLLQESLNSLQLDSGDIELLAVNTGPGSFTGLRVGLAATMGLGATLGTQTIGINAIDATALSTNVFGLPIIVLINASRCEVFGGIRRIQPDRTINTIGRDMAGTVETVRQNLLHELGETKAILVGDGEVFQQIDSSQGNWVHIAPPDSLAPVIGLAAISGVGRKSASVSAYYIRLSEAELKVRK